MESNNSLLADLRRAREGRKTGRESPIDMGAANSTLPNQAKRPKRDDSWFSPPPGALVINLDDDDDASAPGPSASSDTDAAMAARLQEEEYGKPARGETGNPAVDPSGNVHGSPWPRLVTWFEMQHEPARCGNFDVCSNGSSFFTCITKCGDQQYQDQTAHGLEPRPMPGQRFTLKYLPHSGTGDAEARLGLRNGGVKLAQVSRSIPSHSPPSATSLLLLCSALHCAALWLRASIAQRAPPPSPRNTPQTHGM